MKKYSTLLVVTIMILLNVLLTWILPVTYFNGELMEAERAQVGLMNFFAYPSFTFYNFIYVFVYLLAIGGIYGLLNKTGAYRILLEKVSNHVKERKVLCLIITVLLISLIVSFTGFTFEALLVLPFIAGVILLLGYDKVTAAMVTIGSISVGVIGTTFSKLIAGTFNEMLNTKYTDLVIVKVILLVICAAILIFNVIRHVKKTEVSKNTEESFLIPEKVKGDKPKVWPLVIILSLFVLVMIISTIDWNGAFGITFFDNLHSSVMEGRVLSRYVVLVVSLLVVFYNIILSFIRRKKSKKKDKFMGKVRLIITIVFGAFALLALLKIMLEDVFNATDFMSKAIETIKLKEVVDTFTFAKLFGSVQAFGNWTYNDYFAILLILALLIKFTYHIKFVDALDDINDGFKNVLYGAIVAMLTYTVLIITSSHPVILTALKPLLKLTDGLNIFIYPICTFVSALCNTDFTYYQYGVLNLNYASSYFTSASVYPLCGLITQSMYGLALMIAPTSVTLLYTLSILEVKYTTWLKKMWLTILEITLVLFITYIIVLQFFV